MKTKLWVVLAAIICVICSVVPVSADGGSAPPIPHAFSGTVLINGNPAPVDTVIEARGYNVNPVPGSNPVFVSQSGIYKDLVVQGELTNGTLLKFYVNGVEVPGKTAAWESGKVEKLDLAVNLEIGNLACSATVTAGLVLQFTDNPGISPPRSPPLTVLPRVWWS